MRRAQAATQPGDHWALPDMQAPMLPAPGSPPSVSNNAYDLRPEQQAATMRRPPPATVESFAVRQYPGVVPQRDASTAFRVSQSLTMGVAVDPESLL
ncbi:hypothetical protein D3C72_2362810 [compost metagenome]